MNIFSKIRKPFTSIYSDKEVVHLLKRQLKFDVYFENLTGKLCK